MNGTLNTIGEGGCACGDYASDDLLATVTCRKSGSAPECSVGIAHLLKFKTLTDDGPKEIGDLIDYVLGYAGDCVVVKFDETLTREELTNLTKHQ